jgi:hypothetical protein
MMLMRTMRMAIRRIMTTVVPLMNRAAVSKAATVATALAASAVMPMPTLLFLGIQANPREQPVWMHPVRVSREKNHASENVVENLRLKTHLGQG